MSYQLNRLVILIALACLSICSCTKKEAKKRTVGYKGVARANAFLAAQRLLENNEYDVEMRSGLGRLDDSLSTLFLPSSTLNTEGRGKYLLNWVTVGGHAVVMMGNGEKRGNDFTQNDQATLHLGEEDTDLVEESPGVEYLLKEAYLDTVYDENEEREELDLDEWEALAESDRVLMNSEVCDFFVGENNLTVHQWSDKGIVNLQDNEDDRAEYRYYSVDYGDGRLTFLTDASPIRNRYIAYADHAQLLMGLLGMSKAEGAVAFSNGAGDTLFSLIWKYFKIAIFSFLLLIILWLWKSLPRFGPVQDIPDIQMREFSSQVRGVGRFLWRNKRNEAMLTSLRNTITKNQTLHQGQGGLDQASLFDQLVQHSELSLEAVTEAMTRINISEPNVMVRVVKNLQLILKTSNTY